MIKEAIKKVVDGNNLTYDEAASRNKRNDERYSHSSTDSGIFDSTQN